MIKYQLLWCKVVKPVGATKPFANQPLEMTKNSQSSFQAYLSPVSFSPRAHLKITCVWIPPQSNMTLC